MNKYLIFCLLMAALIFTTLSFRGKNYKPTFNPVKVADYKIVFSSNPNTLAQDVTVQLRAGWEPFGGVSATNENCYQAMVKYR